MSDQEARLWQVSLHLVSQTTPDTYPSPINWTQLGVASIVVVLLLAVVRYLLAQLKLKDVEITGLNTRIDNLQELRIADRDAQMERDRERSERVVALLQSTATVLEATPRSLERALGSARESSSQAEVQGTLQQVRDMVAEFRRRDEERKTT